MVLNSHINSLLTSSQSSPLSRPYLLFYSASSGLWLDGTTCSPSSLLVLTFSACGRHCLTHGHGRLHSFAVLILKMISYGFQVILLSFDLSHPFQLSPTTTPQNLQALSTVTQHGSPSLSRSTLGTERAAKHTFTVPTYSTVTQSTI